MGLFVYFVMPVWLKRGRIQPKLRSIVNFYNPLSCYLQLSDRKIKIKSANFTNFRCRMPLFSEYYEKFKNLHFLD